MSDDSLGCPSSLLPDVLLEGHLPGDCGEQEWSHGVGDPK